MKKSLIITIALLSVFGTGCALFESENLSPVIAKLKDMAEPAALKYLDKLVEDGKITEWQKQKIINIYSKIEERNKCTQESTSETLKNNVNTTTSKPLPASGTNQSKGSGKSITVVAPIGFQAGYCGCLRRYSVNSEGRSLYTTGSLIIAIEPGKVSLQQTSACTGTANGSSQKFTVG